jgi:hypothetical protein
VPSLDLRFADNKSLVDAVTGASLVTHTRVGSGTFVNSAGTLQTAATDVPRFDHNPTTGESLGLLVEEARTNLVLQSNAFTTTWQAVANTLTSASVVSPDGTTNGWRFADTAVSNTHNIFQSIAWTAVATTFTIYAKYDTHQWIGARIGVTGSQFFGSWDLQNGVVGSFTAGATIGMQAVGNGWYRLTLTATLTLAGTANVLVYLNNADSAGVLTYTGTGTGSYIYGAQLEAGAFPTSYIPTTTAAATRAADVVSITGSAFSSWYNATEGTMFARYSFPQSPNTSGARVFVFNNPTGTNIIWLRAQGGVNRIYDVTDASVSQATFNQGAYAAGAEYRAALATRANDFGFAENGGAPQSDSSGTMPSVDRLGIGVDASGAAPGNVHIRRLTYWPQALPSRLQAITQ